MITASTNLLVSQWSNSPRLKNLINAWIEVVREEIDEPLDRLQEMRSVETAEGVWLDRIGAQLGVERPYISDSNDRPFGFDNSGEGFDQARMSEGAQAVPTVETFTWDMFVHRNRLVDGTPTDGEWSFHRSTEPVTFDQLRGVTDLIFSNEDAGGTDRSAALLAIREGDTITMNHPGLTGPVVFRQNGEHYVGEGVVSSVNGGQAVRIDVETITSPIPARTSGSATDPLPTTTTPVTFTFRKTEYKETDLLPLTPASDDQYRGFIRARGWALLAKGQLGYLAKSATEIDHQAQTIDLSEMTARIITSKGELMKIALRDQVLPKTAGVGVDVFDVSSFGFADDDAGFDQGFMTD